MKYLSNWCISYVTTIVSSSYFINQGKCVRKGKKKESFNNFNFDNSVLILSHFEKTSSWTEQLLHSLLTIYPSNRGLYGDVEYLGIRLGHIRLEAKLDLAHNEFIPSLSSKNQRRRNFLYWIITRLIIETSLSAVMNIQNPRVIFLSETKLGQSIIKDEDMNLTLI